MGTIILGLDPGLRKTGWGVIAVEGNRLSHVAHGTVTSSPKKPLAERLVELHEGLSGIVARHGPHSAAVEVTFVNRDPASALKLGHARAVGLLVPALARIPVAEYAPNTVKKSIVGSGHAAKDQIAAMVNRLLPAAHVDDPDAADALAVAICHAHSAAAPAHP